MLIQLLYTAQAYSQALLLAWKHQVNKHFHCCGSLKDTGQYIFWSKSNSHVFDEMLFHWILVLKYESYRKSCLMYNTSHALEYILIFLLRCRPIAGSYTSRHVLKLSWIHAYKYGWNKGFNNYYTLGNLNVYLMKFNSTTTLNRDFSNIIQKFLSFINFSRNVFSFVS